MPAHPSSFSSPPSMSDSSLSSSVSSESSLSSSPPSPAHQAVAKERKLSAAQPSVFSFDGVRAEDNLEAFEEDRYKPRVSASVPPLNPSLASLDVVSSPTRYLSTGVYNPHLHYVFPVLTPNHTECILTDHALSKNISANEENVLAKRNGISSISLPVCDEETQEEMERRQERAEREKEEDRLKELEREREKYSAQMNVIQLSANVERSLNEEIDDREYEKLLSHFHAYHESVLSLHSLVSASYHQACMYIHNAKQIGEDLKPEE